MAEDDAYTRDAGSPKSVKKARKQEASDEELLREDVRSFVSTQSGRRLLNWILIDLCDVNQIFAGAGSAEMLNYEVGRMSVGRQIQDLVEDVAPEALISMMREAKLRAESKKDDIKAKTEEDE